jgi:hypothetical protein
MACDRDALAEFVDAFNDDPVPRLEALVDDDPGADLLAA